MPAKEIKELRQAGKLEEALNLAKAELQAEPDNIWSKRNISWVYYDYLKQHSSPEHFDVFISWLNEIKNLHLPIEEKMLFENLCWQIGRMAFALSKTTPVETYKSIRLFEAIESFPFPKPSEGYSFLFKGLHKALKETDSYIHFSDWWDFNFFMPEDYLNEKMSNGREIMAIAEQAYIAYAKKLLSGELLNADGHSIYTRFQNKGKINEFIPKLDSIINSFPSFQYPPYFKAKLLLSVEDYKAALSSILPFAKKKQNEFWVWEIIGEAFFNEADKSFACLCKALSCKSPDEMLVSLRQKMAGLLISKKLYDEAKTEIELLVTARNSHGFKMPNEVVSWQSQEWYKTATSQKSNFGFYKQFTSTAESLLFSDIPEELVIVEFVNNDKKMLNFIASESKFGFFKYDRFFRDVKVGDTLKVRFQGGAKEGMYQLYTAIKINDEAFKKQFLKEVEGDVKIPAGKSFGFLGDVFVHPSLVVKLKLTDGLHLKANAIRTYNQDKKIWSWKVFSI